MTLHRLEDVCLRFTSGGTPSRKNPDFFNGDIPWVKTKELNGDYIYDTEEHISKDAISNSSAKLLPKNTILYAMYGATIGEIGILGVEAACNQACAAMIVNPAIADYRYLYYLLNANREAITSMATGGAQQNLSGELLKNLEYDFPELAVQHSIAGVLSSLDAKIRHNTELSNTLEAIAQTIFKSWFIDFDPVHAKMRGEKPEGMSDEVAALFPDSFEESELGLIPKGWEVTPFGEKVALLMGQSPPGDTYNNEGLGLPFYQGKTDFGARFPSVRMYCTSGKRLANKGETLISVRAPVGDINQAVEQCIIGRGVASALHRSNSESYTFCLLASLKSIFDFYNGEGTVFGAINAKDFALIPIVEPNRKQIIAFDELTRSINDQIRILFDETRSLTEIRDCLLPRLISGELEIPSEMLAS